MIERCRSRYYDIIGCNLSDGHLGNHQSTGRAWTPEQGSRWASFQSKEDARCEPEVPLSDVCSHSSDNRLSPADLARLQQQEQAATKGEWMPDTASDGVIVHGRNARGRREVKRDVEVIGTEYSSCLGDEPCCGCREFVRMSQADRDCVVALRNAAPALLSGYARLLRVEGLRERIAELMPTKYGHGEQTQKVARGHLLRDLLAALDAE